MSVQISEARLPHTKRGMKQRAGIVEAKPVKHDPTEARMVPITEVGLDSHYQRDLNAERVSKMVADWDDRLAGVLILSARGGTLWVVDGQHRLAAMRERGTHSVSAIVLTGLSQREEAALFVDYNRSRAALNEWDMFRAELVAGSPAALGIVTVVNQLGLTLTRIPSPRNVIALGSVRRIYNMGGAVLLGKTLLTIKNLWTHERLAFGGMMIYGLGLFYYAFEKHPLFDEQRAHSVLESNTPLVFLRRAQEISFNIGRKSNSAQVTEAIRVVYNDGLGRNRQLGSIRRKAISSLRPSEEG
jgi:hypothetical protein